MPQDDCVDHAEDVGGQIVEPGDTIPKGADDDVVARLEDEGKVGDDDQAKTERQGGVTDAAARNRN